MTIRSLVLRAFGVLALMASMSAWSQPYQYHVYIDSDQRATTGCTVSGGGQTFEGADYRLTATVSGNPPVVTTRTLAACDGSSFGAGGVLANNYAVGLNNGLPLAGGAAADVIELSVAREQLPGVQPLVTIGFGAASASGSIDVLYTANGQAGGPPMVVGFAALIPTLGFLGGLLLALALAALALRALRHNRRLAQMLLVGAFVSAGFAAWAANFIADGQVGDWAGSAPVGMDAIGDSVPNLSATDIVGAFAADENRNLYFRIDVVDAENRPPVAVGDAYTTLEDTALAIAAPGVLANDSDPDGNPISAQLVTGPTRGTLVLNADGSFGYTPNANANGSDSFTYNAFDGQVTSLSPATVTIAITAVNDVPVFTAGGSQTVLEDAGVQTIDPWATGIDDGDPEVAQNLSFEITNNSNAALFSAGPAVSPTGVLSYTPAANANGSATITLRLRDDGGTANGGTDTSATQTCTSPVTAVNDAPSFVASNPPTLLEDAGAQNIPNWATFSPGPPDEAGQTVVGYQISAVSNAALFSAPPAVANNGTLSYTPAANANGSSTFTVRVQDSGGSANGVIDLSLPQTFTITVTGVNDAPVFVAGPDQTVDEDAGAQTVNPWATGIDDGDPEVVQTLIFIITNNSNAALFSAGPSISPAGVLTYTPAANANGSATITLRLEDNGSNTPPNVNTSDTQTFTITVNPVNDAPSFVKGPDQTVNEDAGAQTVNPWATAISAGPPDEAGQTLAFNITNNSNPALFSAAPAVSPTGVLTYTPAADANGVATITLILSDNGSNTPPDVNTSAAQTFTITVAAVNDAPANTVPGAQTTGDTVPVIFSTANANAISVADIDAGSGIVQMSFGTGAPANGTLTLANPGAVLTSLTGNGSDLVIATGTITALNTALNGPAGSLTYTPVAGTSAARTLTVISNDQGNTGSGGALIDSDTITINVDAAPVVNSTPANGATTANNVAIAVNFNEPVDVIAGITLNCGGAIALGGTTGSNVTTLNLTYAAPLPAGACTLTVPAASVSDVDPIDPPNNPEANYVATFSVDAAPALVSSTPAAAAVVNTAQTVSFTYNEPVTDLGGAITLNCGGAIAGSIGGSGTATLTFTPTSPLAAGASCTATAVAAQIGDVDAFDPPQNPVANSTINFTVDAAPAFVSATPAAAAVVGTGQTVSFTFDENVDNLGGAITLDCGGAIAGSISGGGTPTLTFTPTNPLPGGSSCSATAVAAQIGDSDAIDPPQNPVANVVRNFSVDAAPTVTTTNPTNGAVDVPLAGVVTFNFSENVNFAVASFSYSCGGAVTFTVAGSGTSAATLTPTANLPINTLCTVTALAAGISDVDAADPPDNLAANFVLSFTSVNDNPPSVTASTPANGTIVANNTPLSISFSENIDATAGSVTLSCGGPNLITGGTAGANVGSLTPTYAPPLPNGASCTLTVLAANISDSDLIDPPDQMVANFVATFTVDAPPALVSSTPAAAAVVNTAQTVSFTYDEPVTDLGGAITLNCGGAIAGSIGGSGTATLTFTPTSPLAAGASCTATAVAAQIGDVDAFDPPQNPVANSTINFTVDAAPAFVSATPAAAAVVGTGQTVSFTFDENVDNLGGAITLDCGGAIAGSISGGGTPTLTFTPTNPLPGGSSCSATAVAAQIGDSDAIDPPQNPVADVARNFTVDAAPTVTSTTPANGAANADPAGNITVNFSEAVNFTGASFTLECPTGSAIPFVVSGSGSSTATLDPTGSLPVNILCTVSVLAAQVSDVDAADPPDTMAANFAFSFTPVNVPPVLTAGGTLAYTENQAASAIDTTITVNDADSVNLTGASAQITAGYVNGEDLLSFTNTPNISAVFVAASGTLTLTGSDTLAAYQTALRSVRYANSSDTPSTAARTVTWIGSDGVASSAAVTSTITVTAVDDNPVAVADAATVVEDSGANAIDVLANDTDVDGGPKSIGSVTQPANGTVVITGGGTGLNYTPNANYCNNPPGTTLDTFTYALTPGGSSTTVTMTVTCVDDNPVAVADNATVNEDSGANPINVLANDTDIDGGPKTVGSVTQPANGTVVITGGSTGLSYAPNANYCNNPPGTTPDTFTYTLTPGSSSTTVTMTVTCVNDPPVAGNDTFDTIGNTELRVDLAAQASPPNVAEATGPGTGVRGNDSDPVENDPFAVTSIVGCGDIVAPLDCTLASGSLVSMNANGSFSFRPSPTLATGAPTNDGFQYVITDTPAVGAPANATGTVTIAVYDKVWYVQRGASGNGRSDNPLGSFAGINAAGGAGDNDVPGDYIYVFHDATALSSSIELEANQRLLGAGVALSIPRNLNGNGSPTLLAAAGTRPPVTSATNTVSIGNAIPVEIRGLSLASAGGNAIDLTAIAAAYTGAALLTIADNTITGATAEGIDVNAAGTSTLNLALNNLGVTAGAGGIDIARTAGTLNITDFQNLVIAGNTVGTGIAVTGATFDATPGPPINPVSGGSTAIGQSGNGVSTNGMLLTNVLGDLAFTDLDIYNDAGAGLRVTSNGALNAGAGTGFRVVVAAGVSAIDSTGGPAVDINDASVTLPLDFMRSVNSATTGVSLVNAFAGVGSTALSVVSAAGAITNAAGTAVAISGGNGNVTLPLPINNVAGQAVSVSGRTINNVTFAGAITDSGSGISLSGNTGARIVFAGGISASTGVNPAFSATGGGTVEVIGINTLATTTATALNVANTTIGSLDLNFRSISSNGGASNGITINNTGNSGRLIVTGTGTAASGGTIQNKAIGISLTNTLNPSLSWMQLNNFSDYAIRGSTVNGLTLANSVINGVNGDNTVADEGSVRFDQLTGVASVTSTSISGGLEDNFKLVNSSGSLNRLTFSNVAIGANSTLDGNDGITLEAAGSAVVNVTVENSTFTSARGDLLQYNHIGTANGDLVLSNNSFSNNHPGIATGGGGLSLFASGLAGSAVTMSISGNSFRDAIGAAVLIVKSTGAGTLNGTFANNSIGVAGIANSGSSEGSALKLQTVGQGTMSWQVTSNQIRGYNNYGIEVLAGGGATPQSGVISTTVTGNTIAEPGNTAGTEGIAKNAIHYNIGTVVGDTYQACALIGGAGALMNNIYLGGKDAVPPTGFGDLDFRIRARRAGVNINMPGYAGPTGVGAATDAAINAYLVPLNSAGGGPVGGVHGLTGSFSGTGITCP